MSQSIVRFSEAMGNYILVSWMQELWMNIEKDSVFCLLGQNGAGKTTTISCITGVLPISDGDGMLGLLFYTFYLESLMSELGLLQSTIMSSFFASVHLTQVTNRE